MNPESATLDSLKRQKKEIDALKAYINSLKTQLREARLENEKITNQMHTWTKYGHSGR